MKRKITKAFFILFAGYTSYLIFDRLSILYKIDKSLSPSFYLEYFKKNAVPPPPVYLVSYAGIKSVFYKNQNGQALSAINNGIDYIMMYKHRDIEAPFFQKNKHILEIKTGDGLWIWKPYFMLKTMEKASEDSIIIYADSSVVFKKPVTYFIDLLKSYDVLILLDGQHRKKNVPRVSDRVPEKYIAHFGLNYQDFKKMDHLWSCFVAVRNNKRGRAFIEQWMRNCEFGLTDTPLFDQTMLIIASYQKPERIYIMDTFDAMQTIKNVHRHPNDEYKSLLPDINTETFKWSRISEWGYNSPWNKWLRSIFN